MWSRLSALAGLLALGGCAYDAGYSQSNYASQPTSIAGYYSPVDYSAPYRPGSPVIGGVYAYGDERDDYGGPIFSPYYGIKCDRRRNICWSRNGPNYGWSYRFFGRRHAYWKNVEGPDGGWNDGHWNGGGWPGGGWPGGGWPGGGWPGGGWNGGGHHGGNHGGGGPGGPGPGGGNPNPGGPYVYQVPLEPDGSGAPTFYPNP